MGNKKKQMQFYNGGSHHTVLVQRELEFSMY